MSEDPRALTAASESFEPHRSHLRGLAYRMLGTLSDAKDVVQEAFLRWSAAERPRYEPSKAAEERLCALFQATLQSGDVAAFAQCLAEDAVFYSDGGGQRVVRSTGATRSCASLPASRSSAACRCPAASSPRP